jgi:hypothetical protein
MPLLDSPGLRATRLPRGKLVGLGGLEPPTSRLSGARSSQLSYRPSGESLSQLLLFQRAEPRWTRSLKTGQQAF